MSLPVIVEGGTINGTQDSFVRVKAGAKVTIKADAPAENMQFHHWKAVSYTHLDVYKRQAQRPGNSDFR